MEFDVTFREPRKNSPSLAQAVRLHLADEGKDERKVAQAALCAQAKALGWTVVPQAGKIHPEPAKVDLYSGPMCADYLCPHGCNLVTVVPKDFTNADGSITISKYRRANDPVYMAQEWGLSVADAAQCIQEGKRRFGVG